MTYRQATALLFCALVCVLSITGMAFTSPRYDAGPTPWVTEVLLFTNPQMEPNHLGVTHIAERPQIIEFHPGLATYPALLRWVMAHELTHAMGWVGHPFTDKAMPDEGEEADPRVKLMDAFPTFDMRNAPDRLVLSNLERIFYRQCAGTLAVIVNADDMPLVLALKDVAEQINDVAGRVIIEIRAGPVTLR